MSKNKNKKKGEAELNKDFYSVTEAAAVLGVTPAYVRAMCNRGRWNARKYGYSWFLTPEEIERARGRKTTPGPAKAAA